MKSKTKHNKTKNQVQGRLLAPYKLRKRHPTREVCFQQTMEVSFPSTCSFLLSLVSRERTSACLGQLPLFKWWAYLYQCSSTLRTFLPVLWCYTEPASALLLETGKMMELHASGRLESGTEIKAIFERVNRLLSWRQNLMPQLPALQEVLLLFLPLFPLYPLTSQKIQGEALQGFPRA